MGFRFGVWGLGFRDLVKKPWAFIRVLDMNPKILGM